MVIKPGFTNRSSYGIGLGISTHFKNDLVCSLDGSYSVLAFDSESDTYIHKFPKVHPPSTEFNLEKIEVTIPSAQIDISMHYLFPTHRRWRPFVGLGIGFTIPFTSLLTYEFSDPALAIEWLYEDSNPPRSSMNLSVLGAAGIKYCISHRWYMDLNAEYCNPVFSSTNIPERFNINLGLQYRFR
jgi:outer membrane protein W